MESIEKMAGEIESAKTVENPDVALVGELLSKVADLQNMVIEVVELVSKIQVLETKETEPEPEPDPEPEPTEE